MNRVVAESRAHPVERAFESALKIEGLDAGVVDSLKALDQQYGTELSPLNDRLAQALATERAAAFIIEN